ncbi:MAG: LacI family DNA-binding transcriptional regulator [Chloroflexota bacterium]|nr:LacI family DNA-binding transcriptional regulator [Chloroflexota bacterium]
MKRITMQDVAEQAGVSKATVSHVINETRFVEEATKERVQDAIRSLGYRPNVAARSLTTQRTRVIGLIVSDVTNTFFGEIMLGVEDVLIANGYSLMVCNTSEVLEREEYYIDILLRQGVDGIIAAATSQNWDALNEAAKLNIPIVMLDRTFDNAKSPYVGVNNKYGAYLGAKHLIERGYREIGILSGFQRLSTMRERLSGFEMALAEAGLPLRELWSVASPLSIEDGQRAMRALMTQEERPRAVFVCNNLLSLGALMGLQALGMTCPEDVAIVGFDDHPWAQVSSPPLTVVRQPTYRIGETAARKVLQALNGDQDDIPSAIFNCELVLRQSS